ncbi:hypothetical protein WQ54_22915 [Bacillus sp. SA1-12]|uniref:YndM family protein n=1 Tax=Bacillus sp. SA1-12 TaxID=1455638 RepID=UPI000626F9BD|nr:YndM family protein [Bacillus sp. SA1-12]KKI89990.1 hypothetical protein WQ54_22915 [Bacillus sp. SA1-12]
MQHVKALIIKAVATFVLLFVILGIGFDVSFGNILAITFLLGIISYILGDLLLLPRTSNTTAIISDFALALLLTWFYLANITENDTNAFIASLITAVGVALFEAFFHRYMKANVLNNVETNEKLNNVRYQTEASEELTPNRRELDKEER